MSTGVQFRRPRRSAFQGFPPWSCAVPAALVALTLVTASASAQERFKPRVFFNGFGNVGLVHSTEDQADFADGPMRWDGPGHSKTINASLDSRLGGQATLSFGPKLTAVVQLIAEQRADGGYTPGLEWANVRYAFTEGLSIRGGRIVVPSFIHSDSRKVGYTYPWVRPPSEMYSQLPISWLNGIEATYRKQLGDWTSSLNLHVGGREARFPVGNVTAHHTLNVTGSLRSGPVTARATIAGGMLRLPALTPFFDAFRAFGPEGDAIADRFGTDNRKFRMVTTGVEYDPGSWFAMGELAWSRVNSAFGENWIGYATGGYRWRTLTPYAMVSQVKMISETSVPGLSLDGLPPELAPVAAGLNAGLNAILHDLGAAQRTLAIGTRWDVMPGIALKAQLDFIQVLQNSNGNFINLQPGFVPGQRARLVSIATSFVF